MEVMLSLGSAVWHWLGESPIRTSLWAAIGWFVLVAYTFWILNPDYQPPVNERGTYDYFVNWQDYNENGPITWSLAAPPVWGAMFLIFDPIRVAIIFSVFWVFGIVLWSLHRAKHPAYVPHPMPKFRTRTKLRVRLMRPIACAMRTTTYLLAFMVLGGVSILLTIDMFFT